MSAQDIKLKHWIKSNLIGAYVALFLGPVLFLIISNNFFPNYWITTFDSPYYATTYEILASILNWLPFGLAIGVAQQIGLKQWNIHLKQWAVLTAIFSSLPIFLFTIGMPNLRWYFLGNSVISERLEILNDAQYWVTFICVISVQAFMLRNSVSLSWRWVFAYFLALVVLFVLLVLIMGTAFAIANPLEKFLYTYEFYDIIAYRWVLYSLVLMLVLPIPVTSIFGYLTAKILRSGSVIEKGNTG